jgi:hypothetical protein
MSRQIFVHMCVSIQTPSEIKIKNQNFQNSKIAKSKNRKSKKSKSQKSKSEKSKRKKMKNPKSPNLQIRSQNLQILKRKKLSHVERLQNADDFARLAGFCARLRGPDKSFRQLDALPSARSPSPR